MIYLINGLLVSGTAFLLLFGERIANRIEDASDRRVKAVRLARIDARIRAERDPARRAAWRMYRDETDLENL